MVVLGGDAGGGGGGARARAQMACSLSSRWSINAVSLSAGGTAAATGETIVVDVSFDKGIEGRGHFVDEVVQIIRGGGRAEERPGECGGRARAAAGGEAHVTGSAVRKTYGYDRVRALGIVALGRD